LRAEDLRRLLLAPAGPLARVEVVERTGSTNSDVVNALRADPASWPDAGVLVAHHQAGGRGRLGRIWHTPPGAALTCSFVLHPRVPATSFGWLPLLAGLGTVRAVRATAGVPAVLKWPNDVLVPATGEGEGGADGGGGARKLAGILTEVVPGEQPAVVVGIGVNVGQTADELPVDSATSLALAGARHVDRATLLVALVAALDEVARRFREAGGDARASGLADEVAAVCGTLGTRVRVELPAGGALLGLAQGLADDGGLEVVDDTGAAHRVLAGDVHHVRAAGDLPSSGA